MCCPYLLTNRSEVCRVDAVLEGIEGNFLFSRGILGFLTAVIFRMIKLPELETVVTATHEVFLAAGMAVMLTSISRSITVPLSLPTGLLGSTTPATLVVPSCTSLA